MTASLWSTLIPLAIASAVVPVQITFTVLLVRASVGTAAAWVAGMTATRLVQGVLFGLVFAGSGAAATSDDGTGTFAAVVLLVIALLFLAKAGKLLLGGRDDDAPPPRWMERTQAVSAGKAFVLGAAYVAVAVKLWVFTLGAIGAIEEAELGTALGVFVFLLFVALAESISIGVVVYAALAPTSSTVLLDRLSGWLARHDRAIVIVVGLVFGLWFLWKALSGLGVV